MFKFIASTVVTIFCIALALIPEFGMYIIWQLVSPTEEITRLILSVAFLFVGGGTCVFFGVCALAIWLSLISTILDSRY